MSPRRPQAEAAAKAKTDAETAPPGPGPAPLPDRSQYFPALTGLRAVGALFVFLHHYTPRPDPSEPIGLATGLGQLTWEIHGLPLLLALSGFLIAARYAAKVPFGGADWRRYLWRRLTRIYPLYALLTLLTFAYWALLPLADPNRPPKLALALALNLTFLRGFSSHYLFSGISQGWSLTVEECFYLSAPLLLGALTRYRRHPARVWAAAAAGLLAVGLGLTAALHSRVMGLFDNYTFLFNYTYFGRFAELFAGAALAWHWPRLAPWLAGRRVPAGWFTYGGLAGVALVVLGLAAITRATGGPYGNSRPPGILLNNVVQPLFLAALLYGLIAENTWVARALSSRAGQRLGRASYAFFLIHLGVGAAALQAHLPLAPDSVSQKALLLALLVVAALALHRLVEEPLSRWLRGGGRPLPQPHPLAPSPMGKGD